MQTLRIHNRCPDEPLMQHAAAELQRYVRRLFGFQPHLAQGEAATAHATIILDCDPSSLSPQGYRLQTRREGEAQVLRITGGAPRATMWGAYEVISEWGVHFLVQGDVLPDDPGPFALPALDVTHEPLFPRREFRIINEMANSGVYWSLQDHLRLFDQLAKLRFTGVLAATYHHHPWVHYAFRGAERREADLCYGFRHPLHDRTIGRELLGDGEVFTNPDFAGAQTYEDKLACGARLMHGIMQAAHARGLEVSYAVELGDAPPELIEQLPEWSVGVPLPEAAGQSPYVHRLGLQRTGGSADVVRYRTPLNPVYVDLVESLIAAHLQAYPEMDRLVLWESEFPPSAAGVEECWRALDDKYGLEQVVPLAEILERASKQFFYAEGRALYQAQGAVQTLRLLDILINERGILRHGRPGLRVGVSFFSEHVQPLVERVLPPDVADFVAIVDYLPARVAERMDTVAFARNSAVPVSMMTTVEDDNVGFLPQLTAPALHRTVQAMREYGIAGYCFRQFDISPHEPTMAYLAEAAWDAEASPQRSYRRYAERVAGRDAVEDVVAALGLVEELTAASDDLISLAFLMPGLYMKHWSEGSAPVPEWQGYLGQFAAIEERLAAAVRKSAPRGKRLVENAQDFISFARQFVETMDLIRQARASHDRAAAARAAGDLAGFDRGMTEASELLSQALSSSEAALRTWARRSVDRTDLGTLAALNAYGHDWLRGVATQVYWESQHYGFSISEPPQVQ